MKILIVFILSLFQSINTFISPIDILHNIPKPPPDLAINIVKESTAILPKFDSIGHIVLSTNEYLINQVINSNIDPILKKKLILKIIDLARQGDDMGSTILQNYYNLIDYLL